MDLAKVIRERRESLGMSQAVLAMRSGISRQSIVALEATGECRMSSLRRVANVLQLTISVDPSEKVRVGKHRSSLPVPGERPDIWQLMNQVRVRQARRAKITQKTAKDLLDNGIL